jgi:hypothetical protein
MHLQKCPSAAKFTQDRHIPSQHRTLGAAETTLPDGMRALLRLRHYCNQHCMEATRRHVPTALAGMRRARRLPRSIHECDRGRSRPEAATTCYDATALLAFIDKLDTQHFDRGDAKQQSTRRRTRGPARKPGVTLLHKRLAGHTQVTQERFIGTALSQLVAHIDCSGPTCIQQTQSKPS